MKKDVCTTSKSKVSYEVKLSDSASSYCTVRTAVLKESNDSFSALRWQ